MYASTLNLSELLRSRLQTHGKNIALHFDSKKISYNALLASANKVAHALRGYGVKPNTRVAMLMSNREEFVITDLGIYFSGGTKVALNTMLSESDIKYILENSQAEVLIVEKEFLQTIKRIYPDLKHLRLVVGLDTSMEDNGDFISWEDFQGNCPSTDLEDVNEQTDMSFILYTGGTTGNPKGVVHSRETTCLMMLAMALDAGIQNDDRLLLTTPLPHAAMLYLYGGLLMGAEMFVEDKFNLEVVVNHIEQNRITFLSMVPTIIYRLIDYMEGKDIDVRSIRTIQYGTAPITAARLKQGLEIFGPVFTQAYGLTETQSVAAWLRKSDHRDPERLRSCGRPSIFSQVKVVDDEGTEVPRGEEGEIAVKSFTNMIEYFHEPEKTKETLKDGWLFTGDVGYMDEDGYLYLLDRKKDMIISGGMNVYSSEVENVIQKHSSIRQVAVIGVPDDDWGEAVHAFVLVRDEVTEVELHAYCKKQLSKYKVPKKIHIVDSLPLTSYGKMDKKALREPFWKMKETLI